MLDAACVSRTWHRLASDTTLWRRLFFQNPGWAVRLDMLAPGTTEAPRTVLPAHPSVHTHWMLLYKGRYELDRRWFALQTRPPGHAHSVSFRPSIVRLRGHTDSVYCCCIDDGRRTGHAGYVVSGSRDRTIRVWDSATGACVATLRAHHGSVLCLAQGTGMLVSGSSDATARVWRRSTAADEHYVLERVLAGHTAGVLGVAFDETYVVTASRDTTLRVWRRTDGELVRVYGAHRGSVNTCCLHRGLVASGAGDGSVHVWRVDTGETLAVMHAPRSGVASLVLAGDVLWAGSSDGVIRTWRASTGEYLAEFAAHDKLVRAVAYDAGRQLLVSGGWDRKTRLWDVAAPEVHRRGELALELGMHQARIFDVAIDTTRLISACEDHTLWITDFGKQGLASHVYA